MFSVISPRPQVGPKKKNLKVKDFNEFEFKPQQLVCNISAIYVNLGDTDDFCVAVSRDGRSYSQSLFELAEVVLNKIYAPVEKIERFKRVAEHIQVDSVHSLDRVYFTCSGSVRGLECLGKP